MEVRLLARSSSGDPYTVSFNLEDGILTIGCECQASEHHLPCRHRLGLAAGDTRLLFDAAQKGELETAASWAQSSQLATLLENLDEAERAVEAAKRVVKGVKYQIGRAMVSGLKPLRTDDK